VRTHQGKSGISLIESLVVAFVIAVIAGISYALIAPRAKEAAHQVECKANLRNLAAGINLYMTDYEGLPPEALTLVNNGREPSCPMDRMRYMYTGNFAALTKEGRADWVQNFEPSRHAIIKCIQHNDNSGPYELMPMTNVDGVSVMRKVPLLPAGKELKLLSVLLDGSIKYGPTIDDYMTDTGRDAPRGM
jgi:hypothetical protein